MPEKIPVLPAPVVSNMTDMSLPEIGYVVLKAFLEEDFTPSEIKQIAEESFNLRIPVLRLDENISVAELFEGPTLAFKDFGARLTSRLLEATLPQHSDKPVNVIIATTGNTGSAMANALAGRRNIKVFVVFPRGTATRALESQFTTPGGNIYPVEVNGSIDACQTLVATALSDPELNRKFTMLSVSSGNIARIIGQTVCYFYTVSRVQTDNQRHREIIVSLPCGNLGNLTSGIIAKHMGLNIGRFIACENNNDYLRRAMIADDFTPRAAQPTLAYAADKSVPTNIERLIDIYADDTAALRKDVIPVSVSDPQIIEAINECYDRYGYLLDPHSAMAYYGVMEHLDPETQTGLVLATAHPAKSLTAMSAITGRPIEMPLQLNRFMGKEDHRLRIRPVYSSLKQIIEASNR